MDDDAANRFRLSIRLEASYRALQDQWFRQIAVWAIGYFEIIALAAIPGVHLVTTPYITVAALLLMCLLACVRAGNVLDPLLWPVHVVRPRDQSKFGLGEHQKATRGFYAVSTLIRLACSVSFAYLVMDLMLNGLAMHAQCNYELWNEVNVSRYASKLSACNTNSNSQGSYSCKSIVSFDERCHNATRWSSWLLHQAWEEARLPCDSNTTNESLEEFLLWLRSDWFENEYCETLAGTEVLCYSIRQKPYTILFTEGQMSLEKICPSWFEGLSYSYWCYSYALDAEHCRDDADATWAKEDLSASCASQECIRNIPTWMAEILNFTAQTEFCKCQSCKSWWNSNQCMAELVNYEYRLRAGLPEMDYGLLISLDTYLQDPMYSVQLIVCMLMIFGGWLWLLFLACFALVGNPLAMPPNLELQQRVLEEEQNIAEELRSTGTVIQRTLPFACGIEGHLNRLMMLVELGFYVVDFVLDFEMMSLYFHKQHYWFATVQGCIVARSVVDFLVRHVFFGPCFIKEIIDSFKANLRTDVFLTILQNEKTGEATLSFLLQVYALFYMGNEHFAYWTALFSLLISVRGIAQGCYIHFDLAIVCQTRRGDISRPASVVPRDGDSDTDVVAISVLPTGDPSGPESPPGVASPADGPPMMSLHDEDPEEKQKEADCHGTVCAAPENCAGENMQQTEMNDALPAVIGKGVSVIVPL